MKGFTTEALLLFPKWENCANRGNSYMYTLTQSVKNMTSYLRSIGITPYIFYTDDVGRYVFNSDCEYITTLGKADRFFVSRNCDNMLNALDDMREYDEYIQQSMRKFPTTAEMTLEQKFETILKRNNAVIAKVIPSFKCVITFLRRGAVNYRVASKPGDGKIRVTVDALTFAPTVMLSGKEVNACSIFNRPDGNRTLDQWERINNENVSR